jgi:5-hydroxyisourate hydrolase
MSGISTHVLDLSLGKPGVGIDVVLEREGSGWQTVGRGRTNEDGRCAHLAPEVEVGTYRLRFATGHYFANKGQTTLYPEIIVVFSAEAGGQYHIPLLLSPFGYSTYRGT